MSGAVLSAVYRNLKRVAVRLVQLVLTRVVKEARVLEPTTSTLVRTRFAY